MTVKDNLTVSGFDFNVTNPLQSQLPQGAATINPATNQPLLLSGGLLFANHGGAESPYTSDKNNWQPRIGVTYRIKDWLGLRANYGRSFLGLSSGGQNGVYTTDFQRTTPFIAKAPNTVDAGTPWATPFPDGFLQPLAGELGLLTALGTGPTIPNQDYEIPYTDQWMAGVDIQLPWNIGLDVAYVGNQVSRLGVTRQVNLIPKSENDKAIPSLGGNTGYLNVTFPNPFAGLVPGQGLNAATVSARSAPAALSGVHRHFHEPVEPRVLVLQRSRGGCHQAVHQRRDVRGQLHFDEARGRAQLLHGLGPDALPSGPRRGRVGRSCRDGGRPAGGGVGDTAHPLHRQQPDGRQQPAGHRRMRSDARKAGRPSKRRR